ncbi:hypothetical protein F965_00676 [Acinetobacter schindleri NIPH 900]|uniref:Uncharacterized protein n=1 Tax=Acinetobacter schindleri NIPH 900 TaxID=1217675 RepID=N8WQS2_9GAMM|nr:hypothetical protein F965_00676 [Acinetobacter schindleri NIPH 900]
MKFVVYREQEYKKLFLVFLFKIKSKLYVF